MESTTDEHMLVLCHTFLNDAFFCPSGAQDVVKWKDARFIANYLIIKKAEMPEGQYPAITSKKLFEAFEKKFIENIKDSGLYVTLSVLNDCIFKTQKEDIEKLNDDECVIAIADKLYSSGGLTPTLISGMAPKKKEIAQRFYEKSGQKSIPFSIYDYKEAKIFLHGMDPAIYTDAEEKSNP